MQMHALYKARGREADPHVYRTMDDNIGLMLEYQGMLCEELTAALEADDQEKAEVLLKEQKAFLKTHLTNWVHSFSGDILRYAGLDFYKGVAKITGALAVARGAGSAAVRLRLTEALETLLGLSPGSVLVLEMEGSP